MLSEDSWIWINDISRKGFWASCKEAVISKGKLWGWCVNFASSKNCLMSLPGCNKNHWQNSVEPNQPTKGEFFLFIQMDCLLGNMCIMFSVTKMKHMLHLSNTICLNKQQQDLKMLMIWSHWCNSTKYWYAIGDWEVQVYPQLCPPQKGQEWESSW